MKQIIYSLSILLMLLGCSKSDEIDYSALHVDFLRNKVDVGENSGILEIPIVLSGCQVDIPLMVSVQITATDHSAVSGVDYELLDKQVTFSNSGASTVRVRIIDNPEITETMKDFTLSLKTETPGVQTKMSTTQVYILSDDVEEFKITGHYTLKAQNFLEVGSYTSEAGGVEIIQDVAMPERYYMRNLVLVNGENVLPLTQGDELYITMSANGDLSMPMLQNIGTYASAEALLFGLTSEGMTSDTPIEVQLSGSNLLFNTAGLAAISVNEDGDLTAIHYALKNIILEKVNK